MHRERLAHQVESPLEGDWRYQRSPHSGDNDDASFRTQGATVMVNEQRCSQCHRTDHVTLLADLAPGEPWYLCRSCIDVLAEESARAEARHQGHSEAAFDDAVRRTQGGKTERGSRDS